MTTYSQTPLELMEEICAPCEFVEFVKCCADDLKKDMLSLTGAVQNSDTKKVTLYLHRLGTTFANCGYSAGAELCNIKAESLLLDSRALVDLRRHTVRAADRLERLPLVPSSFV